MPAQKIDIEEFLLLSQNHLLIDVRSPSEYEHAHIPNAKNIALFNDEERKTVGTLYKQKSREDAIKIGLDFFGPKMRRIVEEVEALVKSYGLRVSSSNKSNYTKNSIQHNEPNPKLETFKLEINKLETQKPETILLHCWRGGMRSAAVAWLLDLYGFKIYLLNGGYKAFRNFVIDQFAKPYNFKIIGGYTGSGKTYLLEALQKNGKTIIDLEGIASHKGSALGALGMGKQPTQEMFENILALELYQKNNINPDSNEPTANCKLQTANCIWLEDESQRIGHVMIPTTLWLHMRSSKVYFLEISFEERLEFLTKEYGLHKKEDLVNAGIRIQKRLGGLETKNYINYLLENNFKEAFRILLVYYDKHYKKGLYNRENAESLITTVEAERVDANKNVELLNTFI